jgi:tetratricopeptide (TPR) repeat protein
MIRWVSLGALVACLAGALASPEALAQRARRNTKEKARAYFDAGQEAYEQGKYEIALHEFQESHTLSRNPILYFNMAACEERLNHQQAAALLLRQYLVEKPDADDRAQVENRIRVLEQHQEQIKAPEAPPPTTRPAEPAPAPTPALQPAAAAPAPRPRFKWAWAGLGVTGAVGIAAIGVGAYTVAHHGDLKASCGAQGCSQPQIDGLKSAALATDVLIGITGAAAIATVVLFVVEARRAAHPPAEHARRRLGPWKNITLLEQGPTSLTGPGPAVVF